MLISRIKETRIQNEKRISLLKKNNPNIEEQRRLMVAEGGKFNILIDVEIEKL